MAIIDLSTGAVTDKPPASQQQQTPPVGSGIIDLNTGKFVTPGEPAPQPVEQEDPTLGARFIDLFTGELRQTEAIEGLPELISLDLGSVGDNVKLKASLAITPNSEEKIAILKNNFPDATFTTDENGTVVADFGDGRKGVLDAPGVTAAGFGETLLEMGAFIPAAIGAGRFSKARRASGIPSKRATAETAAVGGVGAGLTQAGIEAGQEAVGGTFDKGEIALAAGLGAGAELVMPGVQALREGRRAGKISAARDEVAEAIEDIRPATEAIEGVEEATGVTVPLFSAQQTQVPSALMAQRILPQLDAGAREAAKRLAEQDSSVFDATTNLVNTIAPEGSIVSAVKRFRNAAGLAIESSKQRRSAAVKPLYDDAFESGGNVDLSNINSQIARMLDEAPRGSDFEKVGNRLQSLIEPLKEGVPPTLRQLQKAKQSMQDIIDGVGDKAVSNTIKRDVVNVKRQLAEDMGNASPLYKEADAEFARLSPAVQELEDSILGQASKVSDTQLKTVAQKIFDPKTELTDPRAIKAAKRVIDSVDPEAWSQLLRVEMNRRIGGLEAIVKDQPDDLAGNLPGQLRRTLFGSPPQRKALFAGMDETQRKNFKYLETVLNRALSGRAPGSPTAGFQQQIKNLNSVPAMVRNLVVHPLTTVQQIGERGLFDRNVKSLTRVMFDPEFKPQMNRLTALDPNSPAAVRVLAQALDNAAAGEEQE